MISLRRGGSIHIENNTFFDIAVCNKVNVGLISLTVADENSAINKKNNVIVNPIKSTIPDKNLQNRKIMLENEMNL